MCMNLAVALVHYPVYNKNREIVTTAVTNLDIHDIARTARTYGLQRYYIVTPSPEQQAMVNRITTHWDTGWGGGYNPDRKAALSLIKVLPTVSDAVKDFQQKFCKPVEIIATGAKPKDDAVSFRTLRQKLQDQDKPYLLILGTGWGLADQLFEKAELTLAPVNGAGDYNHLPVRAAFAIMMDRLLGDFRS